MKSEKRSKVVASKPPRRGGRETVHVTTAADEAIADGSDKGPSQALANPLHERFALEYLKQNFNATLAYTITYPGVTSATAASNGHRLLRNAEVFPRIEFLAREVLLAEKIDAQKVLSGMARAAYYDIRKAFNEKGALLPIKDLPDEVAYAIAGIEVVESLTGDEDPVPIYTKKVKFNDRIAALGQLGKHFKLFTEKVELAGPSGGPVPGQHQESPEAKAALARVQKRVKALEAKTRTEPRE